MFIVEVDEDHAREKAINALKADELPLPRANLQSGSEILSRPAAAYGRVRIMCTVMNPRAHCTGSCGYAGFTQDDGHIFCTERSDRSECARFITFLTGIYADLGFRQLLGQILGPPGKTRWIGRGLGQGRRRVAEGDPRGGCRAGAESR